MSYDEKCLQLAAYFFEADTEHTKTVEDMRALAERIQLTVEEFIDGLRRKLDAMPRSEGTS